MAAANPIFTRFTTDASLENLLTRLGLGVNERQQFTTDGFTNISLLVKHFSYDVASLKTHLQGLNKTFANAAVARRMYFNPIQINRLLGVLYYFTQSVNTFHTIPDIDLVTADIADDLGSNYLSSLRKNEVSDDGNLVKLPSLTGSANWRAFKEKLTLKLSTMKSTRGISLEYIADSTPRAITRANAVKTLVDTIDVHDEEFICSHATHFGKYFKEDTANVATMLKKTLVNTPAYNHIAQNITNKNGQAAIVSLAKYYEGEDFVERNIEQAFAALTNTFYTGEHKNFNFEKYVAVHLEAHRLLNEANYNNGNGMDNATKIQHLKSGIKLDAGLEHAMTTARTNRLAAGDFQGYVSFMAAEVAVKSQRLKQLSSSRARMISGLRGGFRGGGRGGGGGRNGRGGGNKSYTNTNLGPVLKATVDGKVVESRRYSYQEFNNFNSNQRNKIMELHRQRKAKAGKQQTNGDSTMSVKSVSLITESISEAIVAGVKQASKTHDEDTVSEMGESHNSKRKADSGSVGSFMKNRRTNTSNANGSA